MNAPAAGAAERRRGCSSPKLPGCRAPAPEIPAGNSAGWHSNGQHDSAAHAAQGCVARPGREHSGEKPFAGKLASHRATGYAAQQVNWLRAG